MGIENWNGEVVVAVIALIVTATISIFSLYRIEKTRLMENIDELYSLVNRIEKVRYCLGLVDNEKKIPIIRLFSRDILINCGYQGITTENELACLQLQAKHLLIEIRRLKLVRLRILKLSQPQLRLLADVCEASMYYSDADVFWKHCLKKRFINKEIKAEYYRRYGQFLYDKMNDYKRGKICFDISLDLPNDNNGRSYINYCTYCAWINCILKSDKNNINDMKLFEDNTSLLNNIFSKAGSMIKNIRDQNMWNTCMNGLKEFEELTQKRRIPIVKT